MLIQYDSNADRLAAELIRKRIGGNITRAIIDPRISSPTDDILIVGGQYANPTYNNFMLAGILPEITEGTSGTVFVASNQGYNVYACAGWERTGTIAASEYVYINGLPSSTTIAGDIGELYFYEIILKETIPGAFPNLISKLTQLGANISNRLPSGYSVDYVGLNANNLEVLIRKDVGVMALFEPTTSFFVLIVLALVALAVFVWVVAISVNKIVGGVTETVAKKNASDILDQKYQDGEITYEEYIEGIKTLWGVIDWKNIILWSALIAAIGVGGYFVVKAFMPRINARIASKTA